jgi:hypothetical protein
MAYDRNTIPQDVVDTLLRGLERESGSIADLLCDREEVETLEGTFPVEPSVSSLPDGSDDQNSGVAEGVDLSQSDQEMDEASYKVLRYGDSTAVRDGVRDSITNKTGVSSLERSLRKIRTVAHKKIDLFLESILDSTSLNLEADVTSGDYGGAEWDDGGSTSTPLQDIALARRTVPGADMMFIGLEVADVLRAHPDFIAESSNISAGELGEGELAAFIRRKYSSINEVVIGDTYFSNSANEGQTLSTQFDLADTVWLGYKRDLILCEMGGPHSEQERDAKKKSTILTYERSIDIIRPHQDMGITFTNTLS